MSPGSELRRTGEPTSVGCTCGLLLLQPMTPDKLGGPHWGCANSGSAELCPTEPTDSKNLPPETWLTWTDPFTQDEKSPA
jgi:hypothetical protein